ncbi:MAG: hypothetical protein LJE61_12685 [Thiocapsa sp.]|nr:hypothetical protein [Thiocapsa sp.]MCG6986040.1 hypothetical protein [Thiocapsa sp.]
MIKTLLEWISACRPCRLIEGEGGEPYLERYYLVGAFGWHLYLHRFVDSDPDRGLHDHPWGHAASWVLSGGYEEIRGIDGDSGRTRTRFLGPGRVNLLRGRVYHRVLLRDDVPAWTLFLHGPRVKGWGFKRDGKEHIMAKDCSEFRHRDWWKHAPTGAEVRRASGRAPADWVGS